MKIKKDIKLIEKVCRENDISLVGQILTQENHGTIAFNIPEDLVRIGALESAKQFYVSRVNKRDLEVIK